MAECTIATFAEGDLTMKYVSLDAFALTKYEDESVFRFIPDISGITQTNKNHTYDLCASNLVYPFDIRQLKLQYTMRLFCLFLLFSANTLTAQSVSLSGVVNTYHTVLAFDPSCPLAIRLDKNDLQVGQKILIYQAQGAQINTSNNSSFGVIANLNGAGYYEMITLSTNEGNGWYRTQSPMGAADTLTAPAAGLQAITLPRVLQDAVVTDTIFAKPYDTATGLGGVIALDVPGKLTLLAPIWADGTGFQGGTGISNQNNNCSWLTNNNDWLYPVGSWRGAQKGEGIAKISAGAECGRGPQLNGGGGGNDHNSGGGGGGNASRGGNGGQNNEPDNLGCDGTSEGEGGYGTNFSNRIFLGGGGGAGHANNGAHTRGGNGGGIVLIRADVLNNLDPKALVSVHGTNGTKGLGDGGAGGGAGGSIVCLVTNKTQTDPAKFLANGANGGDGESAGNRCFGPGGGGSGGAFWSNLGTGVPAQGGKPGVVTLSSNGCNGTTNGGKDGGAGSLNTITKIPEATTVLAAPSVSIPNSPIKLCTGQTLNLPLQASNTSQIIFEKRINGIWTLVGQNDSLQVTTSGNLVLGSFNSAHQDTLRLTARPVSECFADIVSTPIVLEVTSGPTLDFTPVINGLQVSFDNNSTGYASLLWDFGDGVLTSVVEPTHTYQAAGNYTVFLTLFSACDTISSTQQVQLSLAPSANFSAVDTLSGCNTLTLGLQPQFVAPNTNYQWLSPGAAQASSTLTNYTATYTQSGTYSITLIARNSTGLADTSTETVVVEVLSAPMAAFTYSVLSSSGVVTFTNQSVGGTSYLWNFGNTNQLLSNAPSVTHVYYATGDYVVTLVASNACGASVIQTNLVIGSVETDQIATTEGWLLYPNPATESLWIVAPTELTDMPQLRIIDLMGRTVAQTLMQGQSTQVQVGNLASGVYLVQIDGGAVLRFVKI
jgi:PKD repeat protein